MVLKEHPRMRIGELSKHSGLSRDTIRFYEKVGLIHSTPSNSTSNTYRDYPEALLERLEMIGEGRDAGMSVADLVTLLRFMEQGALEDQKVEDFLDARVAELKQNIARQQTFLKTLQDTQKALIVKN